MEGTRDETHGRVQLHINLTCVSRALVLAAQVDPASFINKSPQDRLGGTHAEGVGHPDKLTVHGWCWYYEDGTHC